MTHDRHKDKLENMSDGTVQHRLDVLTDAGLHLYQARDILAKIGAEEDLGEMCGEISEAIEMCRTRLGIELTEDG